MSDTTEKTTFNFAGMSAMILIVNDITDFFLESGLYQTIKE